MRHEANVKRLRELLDRFRRLARQLARTQSFIDDTYKLVAAARRRSIAATRLPG